MPDKRMTEVSRKWSATGLNLDAAESEARRLEKKGTFAATMDEEAGTVTLSKSDFKAVMGKLGSHKRSSKQAKKNVLVLAFGYLAVTIGFIAVIVGLVNWRLEATKEAHVVDSTLTGLNGNTIETAGVKSYAQLFDLPAFDIRTLKNIKDLTVTLADGRTIAYTITRVVKSPGSTRVTLEDANGNGVDIDSCATVALAKLDGELYAIKDVASERKLIAGAARLYSATEYASLEAHQRQLGVGSTHVGTATFALAAIEAIIDEAENAVVGEWSNVYVGAEMFTAASTIRTIEYTSDKEDFILSVMGGNSNVIIDSKNTRVYSYFKNGSLKECANLPGAHEEIFNGVRDAGFDSMVTKSCGADGFVSQTSDGFLRSTALEFDGDYTITVPTMEECYTATTMAQTANAALVMANNNRSATSENEIIEAAGVEPQGFKAALSSGRNLAEDQAQTVDPFSGRDLACYNRPMGPDQYVSVCGGDGLTAYKTSNLQPHLDGRRGYGNLRPNDFMVRFSNWRSASYIAASSYHKAGNHLSFAYRHYNWRFWNRITVKNSTGVFAYKYPWMTFSWAGSGGGGKGTLFDDLYEAQSFAGLNKDKTFEHVLRLQILFNRGAQEVHNYGYRVHYFIGHSLGAASAAVHNTRYRTNGGIIAFGSYPPLGKSSPQAGDNTVYKCKMAGYRFSNTRDPIGGAGRITKLMWWGLDFVNQRKNSKNPNGGTWRLDNVHVFIWWRLDYQINRWYNRRTLACNERTGDNGYVPWFNTILPVIRGIPIIRWVVILGEAAIRDGWNFYFVHAMDNYIQGFKDSYAALFQGGYGSRGRAAGSGCRMLNARSLAKWGCDGNGDRKDQDGGRM